MNDNPYHRPMLPSRFDTSTATILHRQMQIRLRFFHSASTSRVSAKTLIIYSALNTCSLFLISLENFSDQSFFSAFILLETIDQKLHIKKGNEKNCTLEIGQIWGFRVWLDRSSMEFHLNSLKQRWFNATVRYARAKKRTLLWVCLEIILSSSH